jgi:hypothetical protein
MLERSNSQRKKKIIKILNMDVLDDLQSTTTSLLADHSWDTAYVNQLRTISLVSKKLVENRNPKSRLFPLAHSLLDDAQDTAKKIAGLSKKTIPVSIPLVVFDILEFERCNCKYGAKCDQYL